MIQQPHMIRCLILLAAIFCLPVYQVHGDGIEAGERLILEYRIGFLRQEVEVFESTRFHTKTQVEHQHWIVSGTVGEIAENSVTVDLEIDYKYIDDSGISGEAQSRTFQLKVNELGAGDTGNGGSFMGNVLLSEIWIRRGTDPMPHVIKTLETVQDVWVFFAATQYVYRLGPEAKAAVPALILALGRDDQRMQVAAIRCLGQIGPEAGAAIPALKAAREDENHEIRAEAASALKTITK